MRIVLIVCGLAFIGGALRAQLSDSAAVAEVAVHGLSDSLRPVRRVARELGRVQSVLDFRQDSASLISRLHDAGFPQASIDSLALLQDTFHVFVTPGPRYRIDSLIVRGADPNALQEARLDKLNADHPPLAWSAVQMRLDALLSYYERHGYPFAELQRTALRFRDSLRQRWTHLAYGLDAGPLVKVDSVIVEGDIRERPGFVANLIKQPKGAFYDQSAIDAAPRVLNNTIYYKSAEVPRVVFDGRRARLYIDLERRRANRFDGLLGLLPPQSSDQSLQVTAFLDLRIVSAFHTGEEIALKYENLPNTSQSLDAAYRQPFVFGSNFELSARFSLLKQDTSFLRRQFTPTVAYRFSPELSARIFWERRSESLLDPGPYQERVWPPPPVLDSQSNLYGLGLRVDTRDNRRNPSRGWLLDTDFAIGRKTIQPTFGLDSLDYDRLALDQPRREGNLLVQWFIPTWAAQVLVLGNQTYWLDLEEYYDNDLRQLGGARSLRGFNENSFLASFYSIGTLEYRLRIGQASYIGAFGDVSILEYRSVEARRLRHPIGIGLTMAFETKAGVVNLSYALGRDEDRPFQPARGRIHLGLMNEF